MLRDEERSQPGGVTERGSNMPSMKSVSFVEPFSGCQVFHLAVRFLSTWVDRDLPDGVKK